jgi:hypothetical protein
MLTGSRIQTSYTRSLGTFTFSTQLSAKDVVVLKIITDLEPDQGYYEIPVGLEKNPFNDPLASSFTLGQAVDHITTALEFDTTVIGSTPGNSNLRDISGYQSKCQTFCKAFRS